MRDQVCVVPFNSGLQASHYHITCPSHPMRYSLYLKPNMKSEGSGIITGLKFVVDLNLVLVLVVQSLRSLVRTCQTRIHLQLPNLSPTPHTMLKTSTCNFT